MWKNSTENVWFVRYEGDNGYTGKSNTNVGLRPVITVSKSNF